jgi:predicted RNA-binding Zn ribbon-like protein
VTVHTVRTAPIFVGDHLAMDFLNSTAVPSGERIEWLQSGPDLVDWLRRAGAIDSEVASQFLAEGGPFRALDAVAEQARTLREWLRRFVMGHAGNALRTSALRELTPLNKLLSRDDSYAQVEVAAAGKHNAVDSGHALHWCLVRRWSTPEQLLLPIAQAIGDLVCHADFRLIRACEGPGCVLMFLDRTRAHARRWCSMAVCGNRVKAAAHRAKVGRRRRH